MSTPSAGGPVVNVHATAIRIGGLGILIRGAARSGKSALALSALRRAEAAGLDAALVADDQVFLERSDEGLVAVAPGSTRGLIEVSGVGLLHEISVERAMLGLVADLLEPEAIERLPERPVVAIEGVFIPLIQLGRREASFGADILVSLAKQQGSPNLNQF